MKLESPSFTSGIVWIILLATLIVLITTTVLLHKHNKKMIHQNKPIGWHVESKIFIDAITLLLVAIIAISMMIASSNRANADNLASLQTQYQVRIIAVNNKPMSKAKLYDGVLPVTLTVKNGDFVDGRLVISDGHATLYESTSVYKPAK